MNYSKFDLLTSKKKLKNNEEFQFIVNFLDKEIRNDVIAVYSLIKKVYDMGFSRDFNLSDTARVDAIKLYKNNFIDVLNGGISDDYSIRLGAAIFNKYKIPVKYFENYIESVKSGVANKKYEKYENLYEFIQGVSNLAVIVNYIIGFKDENVFAYSKEFASAVFLTNIVKQIKSDYENFRRIYLPQEEMKLYGVLEIDISEGHMDMHIRELLKVTVARARGMFEDSMVHGMPLLDKRSRNTIKVCHSVNKGILDEIVKKGYNVYKGGFKLSPFKKLLLRIKYLF